MEICLAISVDMVSDIHSRDIVYVSELMRDHFEDYTFGAINHLFIRCDAVDWTHGYEKMGIIPRPRYSIKKRWLNYDNVTYRELYGVYTCGFAIRGDDYHAFVSMSNEDARKFVAKKVLETLTCLDMLPKKASTFDKDSFKVEIVKLFRENGLI